jgi:hypothetical protein
VTEGPPPHRIVWTHTGDQVTAAVKCSAGPENWCWWEPTCSCEVFFDSAQDPLGWFHFAEISTDNGFGTVRTEEIHRHQPAEECQVEAWLNADPALLIELRITDAPVHWMPRILAETPIETIWDGQGYGWRFADDVEG